ncbi:hypothetical protein HDU87_000413 [Geranomyces variabilis]|uniref:PROP1-like PPR domain-containing protein n=1 Tax=Geranomyces variabilis TaxID=109894 RepID=A0AAD5TNI7_9FUNG|nr:hypothetical protein HDU87_000413 [Geranomyces variabilis]
MLENLLQRCILSNGERFSAVVWQAMVSLDEPRSLRFFELHAPAPVRNNPKIIGQILVSQAVAGHAQKVFDAYVAYPWRELLPEGTWQAVVTCLCEHGEFENAMIVYRQRPKEYPFSRFQGIVISLLTMCADKGSISDLQYLRSEMPPRDKPGLACYTALMQAYFVQGDAAAAVGAFEEMLDCGRVPDKVLYTVFLNHFSRKPYENSELVAQWYESMLAAGFVPDLEVLTNVMAHFSRESNTAFVEFFFDEILRMGKQPDLFTYTTVLFAFARLGDVESTVAWFQRMKTDAIVPDEHAYCALIMAYARCNDFTAVRKALEDMVSQNIAAPNAVIYNVVILELVKAEEDESAAWLVRQMIANGFQPDSYTCVAILQGSVKSGTVESAFSFYKEMVAGGMKPENHVYSALAVILGNCRAPASMVHALVEDIRACAYVQPDLKTWTALMYAFARANDPESLMKIWKAIMPLGYEDGRSHTTRPPLKMDSRCFLTFATACLDLSRRCGGADSPEGAKWINRLIEDGEMLVYTGNIAFNARTWGLLADMMIGHGAVIGAARIALRSLQRLTEATSTVPSTPTDSSTTLVPSGKTSIALPRSFDDLVASMRIATLLSKSVSNEDALKAFCDEALQPIVLRLEADNHHGYVATLRSLLGQLDVAHPGVIARDMLGRGPRSRRPIRQVGTDEYPLYWKAIPFE